MWPSRKQAIKNARIARGKYKCASCEGIFGPKEINCDHIESVIQPEVGFVDWNTYISRLFCELEGWQILCIQCHDAKSFLENQIREEIKNTKKN